MISTLILVTVLLHLAALVAYPMTGPAGYPFLIISSMIWITFGVFLSNGTSSLERGTRTALAAVFALLCAFSALSFLPQQDGSSALGKFLNGEYPDRRTLYIGLLRIGIDAPRLLPPAPPEKPL
jgi:hypothetical protein